MNLWQLAFGVALSIIIGWAGYRRRSLTRSGVVVAIVVGAITFGLGGWTWGLLLIAFFIRRLKRGDGSGDAVGFWRRSPHRLSGCHL